MQLLSAYIIAIGAAWLVAHVIKFIIASFTGKQVNFTKQLFISGGMPSSHAATTVAVWTVVLFKDGSQSGLFGLATLVTLVVCYDAVRVRRSVGEQGDAIQKLIQAGKSKIAKPRSAKGHTPLEVLAGSLLGFIIGYVVFITTK